MVAHPRRYREPVTDSVRAAITRAEGIVRELRPQLLNTSASLPTATVAKPGLGNLVTDVDLLVEKHLAATLPLLGWGELVLGEEGTGSTFDAADATGWVVDPIDGTQNFVHGFPSFAVSVALVNRGTTVAGLVFDVHRDEAFVAVAGEGATRAGHTISPSGCARLEDALVATGRPYAPEAIPAFVELVGQLAVRAQGIRIKGPASLDICYVASGFLDGYCEFGLKPWDFAAAALIAREAGCLLGDPSGRPLGMADATVVVASPEIFDDLTRLLAGIGTPREW